MGLMFLAACAGGQLDRGKAFNQSSANAVVIMSITSDGTAGKSPQINWAGFEPETRVMNERRQTVFKRSDTSGEAFMERALFGEARDRAERNYYVFEVEPGGYFLESISSTSSWGKVVYTTIYKIQSPSFVVEAGKAYFIGDFHFTAVRGQNALRPVVGNLQKAKEVLQKDYPKISVSLIDRPARIVSLDCPEPRRTLFGVATKFCAPGTTKVVY